VNIKELEKFLCKSNANFQIIEHELPITTLEDGKKYFDITRAVPTLILRSGIKIFSCMVSSMHGKIDFASLRSEMKLPELKLMNRKKVFRSTGYEVGAIPLVGLGFPCIVDRKILQFDYIFGGSGDPLFTLRISPKDLVTLNNVVYYFE
jgi:prolyl-tRNA editing enzyme YbaK/EbsC (Cys-tRNA(Pro) deacylase)